MMIDDTPWDANAFIMVGLMAECQQHVACYRINDVQNIGECGAIWPNVYTILS